MSFSSINSLIKAHEMTTDIKWSVGKEGTQRTRLDTPPFRVFFTWLENGQIVQSADFNASELEAEVARLVGAGEESRPFKEALEHLKRQQTSTRPARPA